jgi:DNA-binding transcriptional LysR family regulator
MHDLSWDDARLFLAVVEAGSASAAARNLRIAQPTVSRRLASLEDALGFPLFRRTPTGAQLTTRGEKLVEPAKKMAEWAAELERAAEARDREPSGVVRVTAPPGIAFDFLAPFAGILRKKHPKLALQVSSSIEYLDLVRGDADLALRLRPADQRDLVTLASLEDDVGIFASPSYAAKLGKKPSFTALDFIAWAPPLDRMTPNAELSKLIPGFRPAFAADDYLVQMRACEAGLGVMFLGRARHPSSRLKLVEIDVDAPLPKTALHLVCAKRALDIPRVRAVADALIAEMKLVDAGPRRRARI